MSTLIYILYALAGTFFGGLLSVLPGMHILNFVGIGIFVSIAFPVDALALVMIFMGMLVGYIIIGIIQMTYMGVPDDSTRYFAFPNQKYLMYGRGHEAAIIAGMGALGAALILLAIAPVSSYIFPIFRRLTTPHFHWVLIGVVAYLLQSEWPKDWGSRAKTRFGRLKDGWASLSAGWFVFFISMMLGFIMLNISILSPERAFQNLMPVVVGFFGVSYLLMNMISRASIPQQSVQGQTLYVGKKDMARGMTTGFMGGMFSAYQPMITAGPGMKLAGHATSSSGDTQFMISGGAGRYAYYVGAFFLFWVPLLHLTRGALAWVSSIMYSPTTTSEFWLFISGVAITSVFSFVMLIFLSKRVAKIVPRINFRLLSLAILSLIVGVVWGFSASSGFNPLVLLGTIASAAIPLFGIFITFLKMVEKFLAKSDYLFNVLLFLGAIGAFILLQLIATASLGAVPSEGVRAMIVLTISTGIGLTPLTFRTMWTNTLLGYFFPVMLNMAGLSAGIVVALGIY